MQTIAGTLIIGATVAAPTAAPSLTGSVDQQTGVATIQWTAVGGAASYEVQPASDVSWIGGVEAFDSSGGVGFFTASLSTYAALPAGTSITVRVRGTTGAGPSALAGPWSNAVTLAVTGTPDLVLQGLSAAGYTQAVSGPTYVPAAELQVWPFVSLSAAIRNEGNAPGNAPGWSAAIVGPDGHVYGVTGFSASIPVAEGASVPISAAVQLGNVGDGLVPPSGAYTVYLVLGLAYENANYYIGSYAQAFAGPVPGSASVSVQVP